MDFMETKSLLKMYQLFLVMVVLCTRSEAVIYKLNESEYNKMPPLYGLDNYDSCMAVPDSIYCIIDVNLQAGSNKDLMKMIQTSVANNFAMRMIRNKFSSVLAHITTTGFIFNIIAFAVIMNVIGNNLIMSSQKEYSEYKRKHFNHTQIHRGVCVSSTCESFLNTTTKTETDLEWVLEACLNNSLHTGYGLNGRLSNIQYCYKEGKKLGLDASDIVMAVIYVVLILLNAIGTFYDVKYCYDEEKSGNEYLLAFSLRKNWKRLTATSSNQKEPRFERLKVFNGMRTITMFCVIFSHTSLMMSISYVANPLYVETAYEDLSKQLLFNGTLVTHTFFLMSSFLLAYNFMLHTEKHPISWMHFPKGVLLRWLRLTPTYALVLGTIVTWMRHAYQGPMWGLIVMSEANACRQYWWAQFLYINNYVYDNALCMPQTWYLAADTQLFILGLLVCILARSCKARAVTLSVLMVIALAIVAGHTYFGDLDAVVIQSPESYRNLYATDDTFRLVYTRGHTNISACVLGLASGFLTYHWQNGKNLDKYKKHRWITWLCFPLGVAVILTGRFFYTDGDRTPIAFRVLYATFYKPVFQLIVMTIIISCIFKFETIYRGIIEWRGFTWAGRVSYSAFLLHTMFQRGLVGAETQLIYMSDYYVLTVLASTTFLSYLCAAVMWLFVEAPVAGIIRVVFSSSTNKRENITQTKV